jgi:hypothetical protein
MWYMIAEMLPFEEAMRYPSYEFAPGFGFESLNCDFWVYGPVEHAQDFKTEWERLQSEGYRLYYVQMGRSII